MTKNNYKPESEYKSEFENKPNDDYNSDYRPAYENKDDYEPKTDYGKPEYEKSKQYGHNYYQKYKALDEYAQTVIRPNDRYENDRRPYYKPSFYRPHNYFKNVVRYFPVVDRHYPPVLPYFRSNPNVPRPWTPLPTNLQAGRVPSMSHGANWAAPLSHPGWSASQANPQQSQTWNDPPQTVLQANPAPIWDTPASSQVAAAAAPFSPKWNDQALAFAPDPNLAFQAKQHAFPWINMNSRNKQAGPRWDAQDKASASVMTTLAPAPQNDQPVLVAVLSPDSAQTNEKVYQLQDNQRQSQSQVTMTPVSQPEIAQSQAIETLQNQAQPKEWQAPAPAQVQPENAPAQASISTATQNRQLTGWQTQFQPQANQPQSVVVQQPQSKPQAQGWSSNSWQAPALAPMPAPALVQSNSNAPASAYEWSKPMTPEQVSQYRGWSQSWQQQQLSPMSNPKTLSNNNFGAQPMNAPYTNW